jgi:uncharacterized membrane protein
MALHNHVLRDNLFLDRWFFETGPDLWAILLYTIVTMIFIVEPVLNQTIIRSALGIAIVPFIPGYALVAALFPKKADLETLERIALSFGMSIALVPLICLVLTFTPWGFRLNSLISSLTLFITACILIAFVRRHQLSKEARFTINGKKIYDGFKTELSKDSSMLDKALTVIVLMMILISMAMVAYVIVMPKQGDKYTEFYILGPDGKTESYPTDYYLGDSRPVIVGIINHEYRNVTYDLVVSLNNSTVVTHLYEAQMTLADNQTREDRINLVPDRVGKNLDMEFLLYIDGNMTAPYRECRLWVNVTPLDQSARSSD